MAQEGLRGDRIRALRERLGKPQYVVAFHAGIAQSYLSQIENGILTKVGSDKLLGLVRQLETNPEYLLGLSNDPRPARERQTAYDKLSEAEAELLHEFRAIRTRPFREAALQAIRAMRTSSQLEPAKATSPLQAPSDDMPPE